MTPRARRILFPLIALTIALIVISVMIMQRTGPRPAEQPPADPPAESQVEQPTQPDQDQPSAALPTGDGAPPADDVVDDDADAAADQDDLVVADEPTDPEQPVAAARSLDGLHARAPDLATAGPRFTPATLGSMDRREADMLVEFSGIGAGIQRIILSDYWLTSAAKRRAEAYYRALARAQASGASAGSLPPPPPIEDHYHIEHEPTGMTPIAMLAATTLVINDQRVRIFDVSRLPDFSPVVDEDGNQIPVWSQTAPGEFQTVVYNSDDEPIARITRTYSMGDSFDLDLQQEIENLAGQSLSVQWVQYGPSDLRPDRARYIDRRMYRFGYMHSEVRDPTNRIFSAEDTDFILERGSLAKRARQAAEAYQNGTITLGQYIERVRIWPNEEAHSRDYSLVWFGATNRYFTLTVHPQVPLTAIPARPTLATVAQEIRTDVPNPASDRPALMTLLYSPVYTIEQSDSLSLNLGVYGGPQERRILDSQHPFESLQMSKLILFQMSNCCAICTFQWLAKLLLVFLSFLHDYVVFDWALAIIVLVLIVRAMLHPITKKTQINMQRFARTMQKMKPEIDKLQQKYKGEPKRAQQEQLKLFREHGVNPFQMLGCLPLFLQTPIWIALYAMLYLAIELRHEPAFFGMFQMIGNWAFLSDLSSADHFFYEFREPISIWLTNITGVNLLPILMGVIFFVHQKYMSPPPSATMTPEQIQQQKIMKVMFVVLFPILLYNAPSGLTLYILTSSSIGIIESKYIRAHVDQLDLEPKSKPVAKKKKVDMRDPQARAMALAEERMREKRRQPSKNFKKRK